MGRTDDRTSPSCRRDRESRPDHRGGTGGHRKLRRGETQAIAKRAGVGQGTLYRHFPARADLLAEVYRRDVDELVAAAPALLGEHEPIEALSRWFDRVADYARVKRGVLTPSKWRCGRTSRPTAWARSGRR